MSENLVNNKLIAKNTLFLYIRMFLTMGISLFTSRIVLQALGETDYGVYNVVGGFVLTFGIVSNAMTVASQRFISFEIGKGDEGNITSVFSTAVIIHWILAAIILVLAETIGVWFVNHKMIFPPDRYFAANVVFQLSLLTFVINLLSVPYNASLIAFEKMKAFAYVSVIESCLKLAIAYLLLIILLDKLILFAILHAIVAIIIRVIYTIYVKKNIPQCTSTWKMNKEVGKEMISFSGWNTFGVVANIANSQGVNIILNLFFGAIINASYGIATQVNNAIQQFVFNFQLAMNPQIVKLYASGKKKEMFKLVYRGSRFSFMLLSLIAIPFFFEAPMILDLWLVDVPGYAVSFLRIILLNSLILCLSQPLGYAMHASGIVRNYQIAISIVYILALPVAYFVLKIGSPSYVALIVVFVFTQIMQFTQLVMLHKSIQLPWREFVICVMLKSWLFLFVATLIPSVVYFTLEKTSWINVIVVIVVSILSVIGCSLYIGMTKDERSNVVKLLRTRLKH